MSDPVTRLNASLGGRYRIESQLGEGGMATVYLADDLRHERKVALKVLKPELAAVVGAERFLAEIKTTANLQHPHILPLFDSGEADSFLFYVMPYVEGESLRERLDREHQLPVDEAVHIAKNVAEALDYAHRQGVIHRDIKPANVLLQDGKPVISDFGIALAVSAGGGTRLTATGLSLGTPQYMSPEQATGDQHVGPATDIYALGCVLHEMLVGEPPFTGSTPQAILGKIVVGAVDSLRTKRKSVPPNAEAAVLTALEKVPSDRFKTAGRFGEALADPGFVVHQQEVTGARGPGLPSPLAVVGAVVLVVVSLWVGRATAPLAPPDAQVVRFDIVLPDGDFQPTSSGIPTPLAVSVDGSLIVYSARRDGVDHLYSRPVDEGELTPIPGTEGGVGPFFSPDGEWLGFFADGALKKVSLSGGAPSIITEVPNPLGGSWTEDGRIVYANWSSPLMIVSEDGGPSESLTSFSLEEGPHSSPHVLPGSKVTLFVTGSSAQRRIELLDLTTRERHFITEGDDAHFTATGHLIFSRGPTVLAAPLDLVSRTVGSTVQLADNVRQSASGRANFAVSPGGTLVFAPVTSSLNRDLGWVNRQGEWTPITEGGRRLSHPRLSPDGTRVLFMDDEWKTYIHDLARGTEDVVAGVNNRPAWTPDGSAITSTTAQSAYTTPASGGEPAFLFTHEGFTVFSFEWCPDGRTLLYSAVDGLNSRNVWTYHRDEGHRPIANTAADERAASFSPDCEWVAYASIEPGRPERVYIARVPDGRDRQLVAAAANQPVWSPTGEEIFYRSIDGRELWSVSVDPASGALGRPEMVLAGPYVGGSFWSNYDVTRDGSRFLMLRLDEDSSTMRMTVVVNAMQGVEGG